MHFFKDLRKPDGSTIKNETTSSLVVRCLQFNKNKVPDWMMDMYTDKTAEKSIYTFQECWAELVVRLNQKNESPIRSALEVLSKNKMIQIERDAVKLVGENGGVAPLEENQGFWTKKPASPEVRASNAIVAMTEVVKDIVSVNIVANDEKTSQVKVVLEADAQKIRIPWFPVSASFYDEVKKRALTRKEIFQNIELAMKDDPEKVLPYIICTMGKFKLENGRIVMNVVGAKARTWQDFYTYLAASRKVRGKDSTEQSRSSVGYYFGYMPESMYRVAYVVGDIERLARMYGTKCIQIPSISGIFTQSVVNSLISLKYCIRCPLMYSLKKSDKEDQVGCFSYVPFSKNYLEYRNMNDTNPMNGNVWNPSTAAETFMLSSSKDELCIQFSYVYMHSKVFYYSKNMMPTYHAHNGQAIIVSVPSKDIFTEAEYLHRGMLANRFKNYFPYTRVRFFPHDKLVSDDKIFIVPGRVFVEVKEEFEFEELTPPKSALSYDYDTVSQEYMKGVALRKEEELRRKGKEVEPGSILSGLRNLMSEGNRKALEIAESHDERAEERKGEGTKTSAYDEAVRESAEALNVDDLEYVVED